MGMGRDGRGLTSGMDNAGWLVVCLAGRHCAGSPGSAGGSGGLRRAEVENAQQALVHLAVQASKTEFRPGRNRRKRNGNHKTCCRGGKSLIDTATELAGTGPSLSGRHGAE